MSQGSQSQAGRDVGAGEIPAEGVEPARVRPDLSPGTFFDDPDPRASHRACRAQSDCTGGEYCFFDAIASLYGEYGGTVDQSAVESQFNDWASRKLMLIFDEVVARNELYFLKNRIKSLITGDTIRINPKNLAAYDERNHVNLVFLSNELQPNALDASDRRYCVVWTPPKMEPAYYQAVVACRDNGGREAFMDFLLKRSLKAFEPYTPPPLTQAKADLIDLGRPNPERWFLAWSKGELPVSFKSCSSDQAYRLYRRWCVIEGEKFPMSKNVFGRMVMRQAADVVAVRVAKPKSTGTPTRMWWVTPPPDGSETGAAAQDAIDYFEAALKGYVGEN